ncbi:hypothetical protein JOD82_002230 [Paenibacillus sp. 1182]|uniref:hypothetical protein n=1 Tax=Paenibacillus sp. 1182 TaxID=2806565 RepID=UPI001AE9191E|nr:hypothetical protein [Paenibacillus sp. 1182]MBP1309210.1 hypothetical protein [Paenibacillus sp. 1182]
MNRKVIATIENYCDANAIKLTEDEMKVVNERILDHLVENYSEENIEELDDIVIADYVNSVMSKEDC